MGKRKAIRGEQEENAALSQNNPALLGLGSPGRFYTIQLYGVIETRVKTTSCVQLVQMRPHSDRQGHLLYRIQSIYCPPLSTQAERFTVELFL